MKQIILASCFAAGAALLPAAGAHTVAHGRHGGIMRHVAGLDIELVARPEGAFFYLEAEGAPVSTQGMAGTVVVAHGMEKSEAPLQPAGDNKLLAKGLRLAPGAQGLATLRTTSRKVIKVPFTMR